MKFNIFNSLEYSTFDQCTWQQGLNS